MTNMRSVPILFLFIFFICLSTFTKFEVVKMFDYKVTGSNCRLLAFIPLGKVLRFFSFIQARLGTLYQTIHNIARMLDIENLNR